MSWPSRKLSNVTVLSTGAEYAALSEANRELMSWLLLKLQKDVVSEEVPTPVIIHKDNQSCIAMLKFNIVSKRTKH